jgi:hypothetical protein
MHWYKETSRFEVQVRCHILVYLKKFMNQFSSKNDVFVPKQWFDWLRCVARQRGPMCRSLICTRKRPKWTGNIWMFKCNGICLLCEIKSSKYIIVEWKLLYLSPNVQPHNKVFYKSLGIFNFLPHLDKIVKLERICKFA